MDPFLHTYCLACHNVWMYCDCVHSYLDAIPEDGTSHDSDGGGESDQEEDEFPQPDGVHPFDESPEKKRPIDFDQYWNDPSWDKQPSTPNRPPKRPDTKPTPSGVDKDHIVLTDKPKPMAGDPGPNVPVKPPESGYTYKPWEDVIEDNLKRPGTYHSPKRPPKKPDTKPTPSRVPPTDDPSTIALRYFQPTTGRPYPFLTSPDINKIVDNYNMPIYTGPMNPSDESWNNFLNDELWPWYDSLPDDAKQLYLDACFTSDPTDGVQSGDGPYFHVSIKYNHGAETLKRNAEFVYTIRPLDGSFDPVVVYSDYRIPPRAFNNKESLDKYFMKDSDGDYIPRYKSEVNRAGRRDPWFDGDALGERFALKPNYDGSADVQPTLPTIDPSLPPDPTITKPHPSTLNVKFFANAYGNTDALNGIGYKDVQSESGFFEPLFNAGFVNMSIWKTTADKGTPLGYPGGNVPNTTGMSGLIAPYTVRGVSHAGALMGKNSASNAPVHTYGYQVALTGNQGFRFPCEMVNRYASGGTLYACVWVKTKVIDWNIGPNMHYTMRIKRPDNSFYYPAIYEKPIKVLANLNNMPRIAIEQMKLMRAEGSSEPVLIAPTAAGTDVYFCCLVGVPDNDPLCDISRGGLPWIEVLLGGKATMENPTVTTADYKFEFVEISSLWKDNSTWGKFQWSVNFDPGTGAAAEFPTDFEATQTDFNYLNAMLSMETWFAASPQVRGLTGVFLDGVNGKICGENRILNDSSNHFKARNVFWPLAINGPITKLNKFKAYCNGDLLPPGPGFMAGLVSYFKCPQNWLPMTPNGTVPPYP